MDDSITGRPVENIMASLAEFYSANLGEEAKKGMRQKVLNGGWPHKPAYGYRIVRDENGKGQVAHDSEKATLVLAAYRRYAGGTTSLNALQHEMASRGMLTGNAKAMSQEMLRQLLSNPFYAGRLRWKGAEYPGKHTPIIDEQLFQRVQSYQTAAS